MGRVQEAGCEREAAIKQDLSRGREILPCYRAALSCCCSTQVPWIAACALLPWAAPAADGSTRLCFLSYPSTPCSRRRKRFCNSGMDSLFCHLPLKLLHCDHRVHFAVMLGGFRCLSPRSAATTVFYFPCLVLLSCLVEVDLEGFEICHPRAKPVWPLTQTGHQHERCVHKNVYASMGFHHIFYP